MMTLLISLLSTTLALPATSITAPVSVAGGDWSNIPYVYQSGTLQPSRDVIDRIEAAAFGECAKPGQSKRRAQVSVPFLIRFSPSGAVEQVVVHRINCPTIEQVAGGAIYQLASDGQYKSTGENLEGWYRGELSVSIR